MNQKNNDISMDYFPLSIAGGEAFCNRVDEIQRLQQCILQKRPVLLISPRRYGKTSLALRAIAQTKLPYAHIDLFSAIDESDIERIILKGVSKLISRMETLPKKALALASELFEGMHVSVSLTQLGISIEAQREREKPQYRILDILERLEKLAKKTEKDIVLFFDEFQTIREITPNHAIEAVLRQVAQLTKAISFVFSGSNRHLLDMLFEDRNRPFYKLCERMTLDRISEAAYAKYIQSVGKLYWKQAITERELEAIFSYSERHPYYLNALCSRLLLESMPSVGNIEKIWAQYALEERSHVALELELLSRNQKKLLIMLARCNGAEAPTGKAFVQYVNMSKTTIEQSLGFLEKKDYVFRNANGRINLLDPLMKTILSTE